MSQQPGWPAPDAAATPNPYAQPHAGAAPVLGQHVLPQHVLPQQGQVTSVGSPSPTSGLAVAAMVAAAVVLVVELAEAALAWSAGAQFAEVARLGGSPDLVWTGYDTATLVYVPAVVVAYVLTCIWLWSARRNAETLSPSPHTRSRGWVWGGWVVPVVALWFPFQVVRDVVRATGTPQRSRLVGWWWGLWLASLAIGNVPSRIMARPETVDPSVYGSLGVIETLGAVVAAAALGAWVLVVRSVVEDQDRAMTQPLAPPATPAWHG